MVEYIRTFVSGNKKRFKNNKYNLDLSYITPKVIAMAYPGSGFSTLYRNNISEVADFLYEFHGKNFLVFNLSENRYDHNHFHNQVLEYDWLDHHAPRINLLFEVVSKMASFAKKDKKNTIVVHCNAGKGRTGTIICCYLLFLGYFDTVDDCFRYYSARRFQNGDAVTQPCQIRYVYYFYKLLKTKIYFPLNRILKRVMMKYIPLKDKSGEFKPYLEIYFNNSHELAFSNKKSYLEQKKVFYNNDSKTYILFDNLNVEMNNDITIKIYIQYLLSEKKLCRVSFNTGFAFNRDLNFYNNLKGYTDKYKTSKTIINKNEYISRDGSNSIPNSYDYKKYSKLKTTNFNIDNIYINNKTESLSNNIKESKNTDLINSNLNYEEIEKCNDNNNNNLENNKISNKQEIDVDLDIKFSYSNIISNENEREEVIEFKIDEIDPDNFKKKPHINKDFKLIMTFYKFKNCNCNNMILPIKLCDNCKIKLKENIKGWKIIHSIIEVSLLNIINMYLY